MKKLLSKSSFIEKKVVNVSNIVSDNSTRIGKIYDVRVSLAEKIAVQWNDSNIKYAVVHGLENYPQKLGRDLDIVVYPDHAEEAIKLAVSVAKENGFPKNLIRWSPWGLFQVSLFNEDNMEGLPIDLMSTTTVWQAKWISMIDERDLERFSKGDGCLGPFRVSTEGTYYKACLRALVCGDLRRFGTEIKFPIPIPEVVSQASLDTLMGGEGKKIMAVKTEGELKSLFPKSASKIQMGWLRKNFIRGLFNAAKGLVRKLRLHILTPSDVIVVEVNDASLAERMSKELVIPFKKCFVDLRPYVCKGALEIFWKTAFVYRRPPVSEFMVHLVIVQKNIAVKNHIVTINNNLSSRISCNATIKLHIGDNLVADKAILKECILEFLVAKYSRYID